MKFKCIIIILICYGCALDTDWGSNSNAPTIVSGTVIDTTTGEPIDSVEIELKRQTDINWLGPVYYDYIGPVYSNSNGEFYIKDNYIRKEEDDVLIYQLSVGKQGYWYQFFDIDENEVNKFNIVLKPTPTELHTSVASTVIDKITRQPVNLVNVYFLRKDDFTPPEWDTAGVTLTDSQGKFYVEEYYIRQKTENYPYYKVDFKKVGYIDDSWPWHRIGTGVHNEWDTFPLTPE